MLPAPGWDAGYGWEEEPLPFDALPGAVAPREGFVAAANQHPGPSPHGAFLGADHRLALDIGPQAEVHAAVASAEGEAAIELLRGVLEREGWRAYAPKAGVFIEPDALDLFALPDDAPPHARL